jgi:DNA-binding NarL/FixJ family response regulator
MRKPQLLIIEDDALSSRSFVRFLSGSFCIDAVDNATDGLALLDGGRRFDVILCDLNLGPGLSGRMLYEEIARRSPDQAERVVIFTGQEREEHDAFAAMCGERYVIKGGSLDLLVSTLLEVASSPPTVSSAA